MLDLVITLPTWDSASFLPVCMDAIVKRCAGLRYQVMVLDNGSTDDSDGIARGFGAKVSRRVCSMPDALNILISSAPRARYQLFIHADTVLLSDQWFETCTAPFSDPRMALVSPQDIGCGPYSRPAGVGMPESSFMLWDQVHLLAVRRIRWVRRARIIPWPQSVVDFYTSNVTHKLPGLLNAHGLAWQAMQVHTSRWVEHPVYEPDNTAQCWTDELGHLEYGLGNFYSLGGVVTHYHNWYDRVLDDREVGRSGREVDKQGIPLDFIRERSRAFISDYRASRVAIPEQLSVERVPKIIPARYPA